MRSYNAEFELESMLASKISKDISIREHIVREACLKLEVPFAPNMVGESLVTFPEGLISVKLGIVKVTITFSGVAFMEFYLIKESPTSLRLVNTLPK